MSNPKVRSLGRRGGQPASGENEEAKKKGSYSYQVDDETKDIVKSLFEEYASDDGKNFYSGNRDEKSEQEHEEFLNKVDEQLSQDSEPEEEELPEAEEEKPVKTLSRKAKPGKKLLASKEKAEEEAAASSEKTDDSETAAEEETVKAKENKKTGRLKTVKKAETAETNTSETAGEKPAEEKTEAQTGKTEKNKTKTKGKAEKKMKKRSTPNNDEIYDEYDDGYDEYDDYEDEYDDDYDDYDDDFEDDDEDFVEPKRSKRSKSGGGGVEFSLKIVSLTIILVIVLLIMTALFINNRSLSKELQEANTKYDNLVEQYSSDIDQLNAKLAEFTNPQSGETTETADTSSDTSSDSSESSDSDSDSSSDSSDGDENYYIVQSGDTLSKIAGKELGDSSLYYLIQEANNMSGTALTVGDKLIIPDVEE